MHCTLKGKNMNECFISVDIETTGPTPGKYSMHELGACVIGEEHLQFNARLTLLPDASYDEAALSAVGIDDIRKIEFRKATDPREALHHFATWVKKVTQKNATPVFVANNAPFDWMFVAWYFTQFGVTNPFGHSALDMKAYFMGLVNCSWKESTLKRMAKYAGIRFTTLPHRAVDDAIIQSQIFSALLTR